MLNNIINNFVILFISRIMYLLNTECIITNHFFFYSYNNIITFTSSFPFLNRERIINTLLLLNLFLDNFTDITAFNLLMNIKRIINTLLLIYLFLDFFFFNRFTTIYKTRLSKGNICVLTFHSYDM